MTEMRGVAVAISGLGAAGCGMVAAAEAPTVSAIVAGAVVVLVGALSLVGCCAKDRAAILTMPSPQIYP
ncbi:hypothetical protein AB0K35_04455 [Micromonospora sp. NPDC053740]|uniref:hypothetical protein n=1 Tax=Micromonospora sp. NPDC053740 TaxID=3155173 RepID=UPI003425AC46